MKNLKRVLGLMLTVAMMISCFAMSASAAFTDQDKIVHTEAVNMATSLRIIDGFPDGSYHPEDLVTRAQMAKMISVIMNKGSQPILDSTIGQQYKDVPQDHWAFRNIAYCTGYGIVEGLGDGNFAPESSVTGTEAAKMLLVTLGYNSDIEKFSGATWKLNVAIRAGEKKLYDELSIDPNAPLSRDSAAQMIWNALQADEVEYKYTGSGELVNAVAVDKMINDNNTARKITLLEDKFGTQTTEVGVMYKVSYNDTKKEFTYSFMKTTDAATSAALPTSAEFTATSKTDYSSLFATDVKVVGTLDTDKITDVYGMFMNESVIMATGSVGDVTMSGSDLKFGDKTIKNDFTSLTGTKGITVTAPAREFLAFGVATTLAAPGTGVTAAANFHEAWVVDVDGDGKANYVVYLPFTADEVTDVSETEVNFDTASAIKYEDANIYDGAEEGDFVKIIAKKNVATEEPQVSLLDTFEGTVDSKKTNDKKVTLSGTEYNVADVAPYAVMADFELEKAFDVYYAGSYVFFIELAGEKTLDDLLFVSKAGQSGFSYIAEVYYADGTVGQITLGDVTLDGADVSLSTSTAPLEGRLFTFATANGKTDLTGLDDKNKVGFKNHVAANVAGITALNTTTDAPGQLNVTGLMTAGVGETGSYNFEDDAVVFLKYKETGSDFEVKVITGAQAKKFGGAIAGGNPVEALYNTSGSAKNAGVVAFTVTLTNLPSESGATDNYGYVTAIEEIKVGTKDGYAVTVQTPAGSATIRTTENMGTTGTAPLSLVTGDVIKYDENVDGTVQNVTKPAMVPAGVQAITSKVGNTIEYVAANTAKTTGMSYTAAEMTDDTAVIFVESKDKAGSSVTTIKNAVTYDNSPTAVPPGTGTTEDYQGNAQIITDGASAPNTKILLIVFDGSNKWA